MGKVLDFFRKKKNNNLINLIIDGKIDYIDETICTPEELFNTTYEGNSLIDLIPSIIIFIPKNNSNIKAIHGTNFSIYLIKACPTK